MSERNDLYGTDPLLDQARDMLAMHAWDAWMAQIDRNPITWAELKASQDGHTEQVVREVSMAVARLVLNEPERWARSLGWCHAWAADPPGHRLGQRCAACGVYMCGDGATGICPGTQEVAP